MGRSETVPGDPDNGTTYKLKLDQNGTPKFKPLEDGDSGSLYIDTSNQITKSLGLEVSKKSAFFLFWFVLLVDVTIFILNCQVGLTLDNLPVVSQAARPKQSYEFTPTIRDIKYSILGFRDETVGMAGAPVLEGAALPLNLSKAARLGAIDRQHREAWINLESNGLFGE